ncbi:MAG: class I SAM-dependent methyltransferase [Phenylobacterium sp.]
MDEKVTAVLDAYHERIRQEGERFRAMAGGGGPPPGEDWRDQVLLAVGPETGRLMNIMVRSLEKPTILEVGTSFGYSGIWLAEAARATGGRVITLELARHKQDHARQMAERAGLADFIDFRLGDARELIAALDVKIDFVLLDLWKDLYIPCLDLFFPKLNPGAIIVADNMLRPGGELMQQYADAVRAKPGMASVLLPVGSGLEISRLEPR